jgi:type VI secretion system protein ImpH
MRIEKDTITLVNSALENVVKNVTLPIAIRLVMTFLKQMYPKKDFDGLYECLYFTANPSLAFQTSDVQKVLFTINKTQGNVEVEMQLNFLSIFGASSPLPYHYNEAVLDDSHNDNILLDFLNMFNHRLKKLIYPIWRQQRYYIEYENDLKDNFSNYVLSIMGLNYEAHMQATSLNLHKLLPYAGILSMRQKSTGSLIAVLRHYFSHEHISIEEGIVSKSVIAEEQFVRLGDENCTLGMDMSIGEFVLTRNLKFRIHFEDAKWDTLHSFSLIGEKKEELNTLMHYVQTDPLDYDFAVTIKKENIEPCIMGENSQIHLGVNGWIGEIDEDKMVIV